MNQQVYTNRPNGWSRQVVRWLVRHAEFNPRQPSEYASLEGRRYPFSSKRQNDRYARQIAAGKLKFTA
jgi:hypothetical protein